MSSLHSWSSVPLMVWDALVCFLPVLNSDLASLNPNSHWGGCVYPRGETKPLKSDPSVPLYFRPFLPLFILPSWCEALCRGSVGKRPIISSLLCDFRSCWLHGRNKMFPLFLLTCTFRRVCSLSHTSRFIPNYTQDTRRHCLEVPMEQHWLDPYPKML